MNDSTARAAKPRDKRYTISDVKGLYLEILPSGRKLWRYRFTRDGKRSWHTVGQYPEMSILDARASLPELRRRIKAGEPLVDAPEAEMTFAGIAEEWAKNYEARKLSRTSNLRIRSNLRLHILPYLGEMDIREITPPDILSVMQRLADAGKHSTMVDVRIYISHIFRFAAARGLVKYDPCTVLQRGIDLPPIKHHASIRNPDEIGELLRAIETYPHRRLRMATLFVIYSMCRVGEMINAEWREIDLERMEWRIEPEKMKKRRAHIVPLSRQLLDIIETMRPITGGGRYIFPHYRNSAKKMDKGNVRLVLDTVGYPKERITPHGFRSMASTILNENDMNRDWIERQLAHVEGNKVRDAYNYAEYLPERRRMLQWYGDYLDERRGAPIDLVSDQGHPSPRRKKARP